MGHRWRAAFGIGWPLALPSVAAVICRIVEPEWYQFGGIVVAVAGLGLLAVPALGAALYRHAPDGWPDVVRIAVAAVLTVPIAAAQAYAGLMVFTLIRPGWVE